MLHHRVRAAAIAALISASIVFLLTALVAVPANAQQKQQYTPGEFDFYVLALSWSPSYCEASRQRRPGARPDPQCSGRPYAFVVHGLWPQFERGFPSYCQVPAPRLDRAMIDRALGMMPSPSLVVHEWNRHGTCTGMAAAAYFDTVGKARAAVKIPDAYLSLTTPASVAPDAVADAFVKVNPGLTRADMAVVCDKTRLTEVRLCMSKDFSFHTCPDIARRSCKRDKVEMPAMRAEHAAAQ